MVGGGVGFFKNVSNVLFSSFFSGTASWNHWPPGFLLVGEFRLEVVGGGVGFFKNVSNVLFSFFFVGMAFWKPLDYELFLDQWLTSISQNLRCIKKKIRYKKIRYKKGHLYIHDLYIIFVKRITNFYLITSV